MTDSKYMTLAEENGNIKISEEVIAAIAVGAAREVEGVADMVNNLTGSVSDLMNNKKGAQKGTKGVKIDMTGAALTLTLSLAVRYGHAVRDVAESVQKSVASAVEAMERCRVPVFFAHGEPDDFVPCDMSRTVYEACTSPKRLVTVPGAGHGLCYITDPLRYEQVICRFLRSVPALKDTVPDKLT